MKKIITRISEGLGNQLFMYAHAYSLSKKIDYDLYIDNASGYYKKKNQIRSYELDKFNIDHNLPDKKYKFDTFFSNLNRNLLKKIDFFKKNCYKICLKFGNFTIFSKFYAKEITTLVLLVLTGLDIFIGGPTQIYQLVPWY